MIGRDLTNRSGQNRVGASVLANALEKAPRRWTPEPSGMVVGMPYSIADGGGLEIAQVQQEPFACAQQSPL